jgi:hypothetical protein
MSCTTGLFQTNFIPALLGVLIFAEMFFYLIKLTVVCVGQCFHYQFPSSYWWVVDLTFPIATTIFMGMLIQRDGGVANMFPVFDPLTGLSGSKGFPSKTIEGLP